MLCTTVENGFIKEVSPLIDGTCANHVVLSVNEFANITSQITSQEILTDFTWGFGTVIFFWSLGYAVGVSKAVIRKA